MTSRTIVTGAILVVAATPTRAQLPNPADDNRLVRVMTRNLYHGVDAQIFDVPNATTVPDLLNKVAAVYNGYFTSNFAERAEAVAAEIEATRPDLIGLQEAILVRTQFPPDGGATLASDVALDYLQILLDALAERGLRYDVAVQTHAFDFELPSALGFDVRHTDREVILARADLSPGSLKLSNAQSGAFAVNCAIPTTLLGPITIQRNWVSVDAKIRGASLRFLSTHLDGDCLPVTSSIQRAQARELLAGPAATEVPTVLVGDLNSPADGTGDAYNDLISAGFSDVWPVAGNGAGLTCCQADDLLNVASILDRRIDLILFRGGLATIEAVIVGDDASRRTASGLWPSDHAGVTATLAVLK